jgi:hypothetical protein
MTGGRLSNCLKHLAVFSCPELVQDAGSVIAERIPPGSTEACEIWSLVVSVGTRGSVGVQPLVFKLGYLCVCLFVCLFVRHPGRQINLNPWQRLPLFKLGFCHVPWWARQNGPIIIDDNGLAIWVIGKWICDTLKDPTNPTMNVQGSANIKSPAGHLSRSQSYDFWIYSYNASVVVG